MSGCVPGLEILQPFQLVAKNIDVEMSEEKWINAGENTGWLNKIVFANRKKFS